jgi:hypothetical protein
MKRVLGVLAAVVGVLAISAGSGAARTTQATVGVYPSGTSFQATGAVPAGATTSAALAMPIGGVDDATILVSGAQNVAIQSPTIAAPLQLKLMFAHYVSVQGTPIPDALLPWDGAQRAAEKTNQPLWLQVTVPYGTAPGAYAGSVQVVADGVATTVPLTVTVYNVTLPQQNQAAGSLLTAFSFSPQSYGLWVNKLYGVSAQQSLAGLFSFFASYRLSPNNWGYGNPNVKSGYTSSNKWWLDKAGQMVSAVGEPRQFASMWIPVSNNRWPKNGYVGGLSPYKPQAWCSYLKSVHDFWDSHGWLTGSYPYLYGLDEPGTKNYPVLQQQAQVTHSCFPGGHVLITGAPSAKNKALWNGGSDDVDDWVVLASRYYGKFTVPVQSRKHISHATDTLKTINTLRQHGKQIWTYTYNAGSHSTPGFTATEPLSDPRMFVDWAALEGITGLLYGQGTTTYNSANPLNTNDREGGAYVLIYPGKDAPIPSARLELIREGIEDWEILNVVRQNHGAAAVAKLLSSLFSTSGSGAKLGCTIGCDIKTTTPYSWPTYSRDATTPGKLAAMRSAALLAASS